MLQNVLVALFHLLALLLVDLLARVRLGTPVVAETVLESVHH